jgi:uncharacterized protein (TIGR03083 family)
MKPPASLRSRVLTEARARRWDPHRLSTEVIDPYLLQVRTLDSLLSDLTPAQWRTPVPRHGDITGLVTHLAGNDAMVLTDLESQTPTPVVATGDGPSSDPLVAHERWRAQSSNLVTHLRLTAPRELERPVRLAGRNPVYRSLREGMVQRAFETWIHTDDVRSSLQLMGPPPPPRHLRSIVDLAVTLLPVALIAASRDHSGKAARMRLSEAGEETEWRLRLGDHFDPDADAAVTIYTDMAAFCQLVAGRRTRHDLTLQVTGEEALAVDLLEVASTLGCD